MRRLRDIPRPRLKGRHRRQMLVAANVQHLGRPRCRACNKVAYVTVAEAEQAIAVGYGRDWYPCPDQADTYHLTTRRTGARW